MGNNTEIQQNTPYENETTANHIIEKSSKSIHHLGLIVLFYSSFSILVSIFSVVAYLFLLNNSSTFNFLTPYSPGSSLFLFYSILFFVIILQSILIYLANKTRKDSFEDLKKTKRNLTWILIIFIATSLGSFIYNLYLFFENLKSFSPSFGEEFEISLSFPLLEIIILIVIIKGFTDLKKIKEEIRNRTPEENPSNNENIPQAQVIDNPENNGPYLRPQQTTYSQSEENPNKRQPV